MLEALLYSTVNKYQDDDTTASTREDDPDGHHTLRDYIRPGFEYRQSLHGRISVGMGAGVVFLSHPSSVLHVRAQTVYASGNQDRLY